MDDLFVFIILTIFFIVKLIIVFKQHEKKIIHNNKCEPKLCNPCDQHPKSIDIVKFDDQIVPLIYYIDGSYSHRMQIGHSGFRASDGSSAVHCYSPQYPRRGSTESEVHAACLAIQHAMENRYTTLIIRTDNSKVEQLLRRPKDEDNRDYSFFCQILNEYRQENGNHIIQVERVRGHTTRYEQNQCEIKREFAKTDRLVRKKNHRYIRRQRIKNEQYHLYWYPQCYTLTYYRYTVSQYNLYF
jgi:ribonuclease HI